ncbi:MAG: hypothetical protein J2P17_19545, partial [Mycobacterium sp.]|nr:hypothetical protein [Mycobacterium sp.]
ELHRQHRLRDKLLICIFLDRVLAPWWIEFAEGRIVNAHSAVLPHARGMFALEQVAASGDIDRFRRCAGATVHFVDEGVDTGPIIRAERFANPFVFESIYDCKAASYLLAFDLLVGVVRDLLLRPDTVPAGIVQSRAADRDFHSSEFDERRRLAAAEGYLLMKHRAGPQRSGARATI